MVMPGWSVHLTTLFFLGKLEQAVNKYSMHILLHVTDNNPARMNQRKVGEALLYFHLLCMWAASAWLRLCIRTGWNKPWLLANVILI